MHHLPPAGTSIKAHTRVSKQLSEVYVMLQVRKLRGFWSKVTQGECVKGRILKQVLSETRAHVHLYFDSEVTRLFLYRAR